MCPEGTENLKMNFGILVYGGTAFLVVIGLWNLYHYMQDRMRRVRERLRMDELITFVARSEKISDVDFTVISAPINAPKPKLSKRARQCEFILDNITIFKATLTCALHCSSAVVLEPQKRFFS